MKIAKKRDLFVILGFLLIVGIFVYFGTYFVIGEYYGQSLHNLSNCIGNYIEKNSGSFPKNEKSLISDGFIKKSKNTVQCKYYFTSASNPEKKMSKFVNCNQYDLFQIRYGTEFDNIKMSNGKIYDKISGDEIFLINGPFHFFLDYKKHNSRLYKKMKISRETQLKR